MKREEAYRILTELIKNQNLFKHHLACEAVMEALCLRFNPKADADEIEKWGIVGLLHDADYELTKDTPEKHGIVIKEKNPNLPEDIWHAIASHNGDRNGITPENLMDWSIYCCDELTGLIVAAALVHPDRRLASLTVDFIINRFKEKTFAKGADREMIKKCEEKLDIPLNEFIDIGLKAMQTINKELGL